MKIESVHVKQLFGEFDYSLEICDTLTFLHSPNGYGKSTLMRMLYSALSGETGYLSATPFVRLDICFESDACLSVSKEGGSLRIHMTEDGQRREITAEEMSEIRRITYIPPERLMIVRDDGELAPALASFAEELRHNLSEKHGKELDESLGMFLDIANSIFINKKVSVDGDNRLTITMNNGAVLQLPNLSSGERQILIIFYTLLFRATPGSFVIIDEPEISLHVSWQQRLGDFFMEICEQRGIQMIVATHSPTVIHDKWDMARELKAENARVSDI